MSSPPRSLSAVSLPPPPWAGRHLPPAGEDKVTRVIVRAEPGSLPAVGDAATSLGGQVVSSQHALSTVVVDMPDRAVSRLREPQPTSRA